MPFLSQLKRRSTTKSCFFSFDGVSISANAMFNVCCKRSSGNCSTTRYPLDSTSNARICSHKMHPVVIVLLSKGICNGKLFFVFVIGQTIASLAFSLNVLLLITTAERYPACSCPDWGLKFILIIEPCFTIFRYPLFLPSLFLLLYTLPDTQQTIHQ